MGRSRRPAAEGPRLGDVSTFGAAGAALGCADVYVEGSLEPPQGGGGDGVPCAVVLRHALLMQQWEQEQDSGSEQRQRVGILRE